VLKVDEYGRVLTAFFYNDLYRSDDDVCVETSYPMPIGNHERVLFSPSSRRIWNCLGKGDQDLTWAAERFEYDNLPLGLISNGFLTSHTVERRATDDGSLLPGGIIRSFDASYDFRGNVKTLTTQREDGATRTVSFEHDPFGLAPVQSKVDATDTPSLVSRVTRDALTLDVLSATDPNQTQRGVDVDGFGRIVRSTLTPPGGSLGVLLTVNYLGFSGPDPLGRRIVTKSFSDPVLPGNTGGGLGRTRILYLDELSRVRRTELALGADYANQTLIERMRHYDGLGRVAFEADPFPSTEDPGNAYGTTYVFSIDGSPLCFTLGKGPQGLSMTTDELTERYPTCFTHSFANHEEIWGVSDADSLLSSSPQAGVTRFATKSGIGWVTSRATWQSGKRLEYSTFLYDHLGQLTSMTRYEDPVAPSNPVEASRQLDSLGQVLRWQEPESAPQYAKYSDWGDLLEVQWTDSTTVSSTHRRVLTQYDALSRVTHREERNNGVIDPATLNDYFYDVGANVAPQVTPTYLFGRLAHARSPTGEVYYSYDAFGQANARVFTDGAGTKYIEKITQGADGAPLTLEFYLPDTAFNRELVEYGYDSASRIREMKFFDGSILNILYEASDIDPLGRVRKATFGGVTHYTASYAAGGRRLIKEMGVDSAHGARRIFDSRYDPVGRELSRREVNGEGVITGTNVTYDALGRLRDVVKVEGGTTLPQWAYGSDPLGNVHFLRHFPDSTPDAWLSYQQVGDRDRVCRIDYGPGPSGAACNVVYDGVGNTIEQVTRTGVRRLSYFASGNVRSITEGAALANFRYDAFGDVQELDIAGPGISDARHDRRYGGLITRHDKVVSGTTTAFVSRNIPGPGVMISKRGTDNEWIFGFGELRGNRFFVDGSGAFVQTVDYQPYGEAKSNGVQPGSPQYTSLQWNGRDALGAFNLSHLGARLYDPVIGRFLSRDPLVVPRTATTSNPYAFVTNDPINFYDPSGMQENFCFGSGCPSHGDPPIDIPPELCFPRCFSTAPAGANPRAANRIPAPTALFNPPHEPQTLHVPESAEGVDFYGYKRLFKFLIQGLRGESYIDFLRGGGPPVKWRADSLKWGPGREADILEFLDRLAEYKADPSGENEGKLILSWESMGAGILGGWAGGAIKAAIWLGEKNWDEQQRSKEIKERADFRWAVESSRKFNDKCTTAVACGENDINDFYYNHGKWEREHLPESLWGQFPLPFGPQREPPLEGDACIIIYLFCGEGRQNP
jgi:RHS repeat-associated protein